MAAPKAKAKAKGTQTNQGNQRVREMGLHINNLEHQIHDMKMSTGRRNQQHRQHMVSIPRSVKQVDPQRAHLARLAKYCSFNGKPVPRLMPDGQAMFMPDANVREINTYIVDKIGDDEDWPVRTLVLNTNLGISSTVAFVVQWQKGAGAAGTNTNVYAMPITLERIPANLTNGTAPSSGLADTCTIALQNTTASRFVQGPVSVATIISRLDGGFAPAGGPSSWPIVLWDKLFDTWKTMPQPKAVRMNAPNFCKSQCTWSYPRDNITYNQYEKFIGDYGGPSWEAPLKLSAVDPYYGTITVGQRLDSFMGHIIATTGDPTTSTLDVQYRWPMSLTAVMVEQVGASGVASAATLEKQQSYTITCTGTYLFRFPQNNPMCSMQRNIPTETPAKIVHHKDGMESAGATIMLGVGAAVLALGGLAVGGMLGGPAGAVAGAEAGTELAAIELAGEAAPLLGEAAASPIPATAGLGGAAYEQVPQYERFSYSTQPRAVQYRGRAFQSNRFRGGYPRSDWV